jgi:PST family polysaccharide transporter
MSRLLGTLLSVVFARVLGPQQMGLLSAAQLLPSLLLALNALAETAALVRRPATQSGPAQARGAARLRMVVAVASVVVSAAAGPSLIRAVLGDGPELSQGRRLLAILTLGLLVDALGAFPRVTLQWQLRLRAVILAGLAQVVTHVSMSLVLLALGGGLEALCGAVVFSQAVGTGVAWAVIGRPRSDVVRECVAWRHLMSQYSRLFMSTSLGYVNMRLDNFLVGATLGASSMALYSVAWTASRSLAFVLAQTYTSAVLPVLAAAGEVPGRLEAESGRAFRWSLWMVCSAGAALWATCDPLLPLMLGEAWRPAILPLRVMVLALVGSTVISAAQTTLIAEGRAERIGLAALVNSVVVLAAVPPAARAWGLVGAAWVDVAAATSVASVLVAASPSFRSAVSTVPWRRVIEPLVVGVTSAAVAVRFEGSTPAATLATRAGVFAGVLLSAALIVDKEQAASAARVIAIRFRR